jgi:hypothetical protein
MSAIPHSDRSADDLVCWFLAGGEGARRSSSAEPANGRAFHAVARGPTPPIAFATLETDCRRRRCVTHSHTGSPLPAINRHSA